MVVVSLFHFIFTTRNVRFNSECGFNSVNVDLTCHCFLYYTVGCSSLQGIRGSLLLRLWHGFILLEIDVMWVSDILISPLYFEVISTELHLRNELLTLTLLNHITHIAGFDWLPTLGSFQMSSLSRCNNCRYKVQLICLSVLYFRLAFMRIWSACGSVWGALCTMHRNRMHNHVYCLIFSALVHNTCNYTCRGVAYRWASKATTDAFCDPELGKGKLMHMML